MTNLDALLQEWARVGHGYPAILVAIAVVAACGWVGQKIGGWLLSRL